MKVLPLFKSQYSVGRSILTFAAPGKEIDENYPVSVFDIAVQHKLSQVTVVDDSISGFLEAHQNANKASLKLVYGVQMRCMENIEAKSEASLKTISKVIVFIKNTAGYKDLLRITSCAAKKGFYYKPNIDWAHLAKLWTPNLMLAIPFYDGFLFRNTLEGFRCVPNFPFTQPVFFIEHSGLPFDKLIQDKTRKYVESTGGIIIPARTILYYKRADFIPYLTFRCIHDRTDLQKPELEHMSSDWFCFEEWENQENGRTPIEI